MALIGLDENALTRTLFARLLYGVFEFARYACGLRCAPGRVVYGITLLDISQSIIKEGKHGRTDLLAKTISRAEILIDPDLHCPPFSDWLIRKAV